jgi:single-strand selective monofunctional uracil DNA glycosylase
MNPVQITDTLREALAPLRFAPPVTHVYNPLEYAGLPFRQYLERYGDTPKEVVLVGMNPGPWGMVQTGVPFGEVRVVREWLGIEAPVGKPSSEHPKRPVQGFACKRSEVSGARLWGWAQATFGPAERFFERFFVYNYCPLSFMEASGRNRTPDKLPRHEREPLFAACDAALRDIIAYFQPKYVLGIGAFAEGRVRVAVGDDDSLQIGHVLHPSPASPLANAGWGEQATGQLEDYGIQLAG